MIGNHHLFHYIRVVKRHKHVKINVVSVLYIERHVTWKPKVVNPQFLLYLSHCLKMSLTHRLKFMIWTHFMIPIVYSKKDHVC